MLAPAAGVVPAAVVTGIGVVYVAPNVTFVACTGVACTVAATGGRDAGTGVVIGAPAIGIDAGVEVFCDAPAPAVVAGVEVLCDAPAPAAVAPGVGCSPSLLGCVDAPTAVAVVVLAMVVVVTPFPCIGRDAV